MQHKAQSTSQASENAPAQAGQVPLSTPIVGTPQADQRPPGPVPVDADMEPTSAPAMDMLRNMPVPMATEHAETSFDMAFTAETFKALVESHYAGIVLYDIQGLTTWLSSQACGITGHTLEERKGCPGYELIHPDDFEEAARLWMYLLAEPGRTIHTEQRVVHKDGRTIWVETQMKNMIGVEPLNAIVANYHDITERKNAHAALRASEQRQRELANRDHLTNLLNRRALTAELEQAVLQLSTGELEDFGFLFVDLDGFKKVNDRLGHGFGDEYLRKTAERLTEAIGEEDVVARVGGDEFAIIARSCATREEAQAFAHRLVHKLSDPVRIRSHLVQLPACVGVVTAGGRPWRPLEYFKYADAALYAAKYEGTGRVRIFDDELESHLREQSSLASELSGALDAGQLGLLYQPIVDLGTREVVGLEALVCWNHPERGLLRAGAFINAAEETGLVIPIGEWVFDQVCKDASRWSKTFGDKAPWVSANLSSAQLIRQDFPEFVEHTIRSHEIPEGLVRFELTERGLFETEGPWRDRLWTAQDVGVPLMLDDFGTGYTSMRYLAEFPISVLKLDREYINKSTSSDPNRRKRALALVEAVSQMSNSLDMIVIAEGVETEEQHEAVKAAGCQLGQGWLYQRAMKADAVDEKLRDGGWVL